MKPESMRMQPPTDWPSTPLKIPGGHPTRAEDPNRVGYFPHSPSPARESMSINNYFRTGRQPAPNAPRRARRAARVMLVLTLFAGGPGPGAAATTPPPARTAFPAVVNPAVRSSVRPVISLDGDWSFATDPEQRGEAEGWFRDPARWEGTRTITVPGAWEAQGVGGVGWSQPREAPRRYVYEPVMRRLRSVYTGAAWYRKTIRIPEPWNKHQIWLKVGGVNAQGRFWVNGQFVAENRVYCGTYKYDITDLVTPGEVVTVVAEVRNDIPSRRGCSNIIRTYGGLFRSVELEATPPVSLENVYAMPEIDQQRVRLKIQLRAGEATLPGETLAVRVKVRTWKDRRPAGELRQDCAPVSPGTSDLTLDLPLSPCILWSPENPFLYEAEVTLLRNEQVVDGWVERFGLKQFEVRGGAIFLNHQRYFLRGAGDDHVYPLTVCSPASRQEHIQHLQKAKAYGFNYIRLHTHCEIPEYFEAADEVGMLIQPELPYWAPTNHMSNGFVDPAGDLQELVTHYRRYTSLGTYCGGNEGDYGSPLGEAMYRLAKALDPSRPWISQDGGKNRRSNSDIHCGAWEAEHGPYAGDTWPHVLHEYMSLGLDEDPRLEPKYTGAYLPNLGLHDAQALVQDKVRLPWEWAVNCLDAGRRLQGIYHKLDIETARLDPVLDGFICWLMVDISPNSQNGVLDMFWDMKQSPPQFFQQFNAPIVILARNPREKADAPSSAFRDAPVFTAGDALPIEWVVSNFSGAELPGASIHWKLSADGQVLMSGNTPEIRVASGAVTGMGVDQVRIPDPGRPLKARFEAVLVDETSEVTAALPDRVENHWDVWLFPKFAVTPDSGQGLAAPPSLHQKLVSRYPGIARSDTPAGAAASLLISPSLDDPDTVAALEAGKRVLLLSLPGLDLMKPGVRLGWWGTSGQTGTSIARHPAFGNFPHDGFVDQLFFRLVGTAEKLDPGHAFAKVHPLMVGTGRDYYIFGNGDTGGWWFNLYMFEAQVGAGRLLASGLNLETDHPEAIWLLDQLIRYTRSDQFQPSGAFDLGPWREKAAQQAEFRKRINGFSALLPTTLEVRAYPSFAGTFPMRIVRQTTGNENLAWRTLPVPETLKAGQPFTFRWLVSTGYKSQPAGGHFTLSLNDRELLQFDVAFTSQEWQSADASVKLHYEVRRVTAEDSDGVMTLTLPGALLQPGRPAKLAVRGSSAHSLRYFGLYEFP